MTILTVGEASRGRQFDAALAAAGHHVVRAGTSREALARAKDSAPDLVVLDGQLPQGGASRLMGRLRALPALADVPFVQLDATAPSRGLVALRRLAKALDERDSSRPPGGGGAAPAPEASGRAVDLRTLERQLAQARKMEAVGQLAEGVAHDFSNLLSVIWGYAEQAAKAAEEKDPVRRYLDEIRLASDRAAHLIRQLLAFGRSQAAEPTFLEPDDVVRRLEGMLRRLIPEDVELVTTARAPGALVNLDRSQLEQVVINLAVNARDAMPRGGRLLIETACADLDEHYCRRHLGATPGPHVLLAVSDTGIGMDRETQARIFEPFFTTKEGGRGTGLGLATVHGVVRQAGGSIGVYSEPGRGTVFKIYLPRVTTFPDAAELPGPPQVSVEKALAGTETILLVEDEETLRLLTREALEALGYTVLEARQGIQALELYEEHRDRIDLLLTDLVMPRMSGEELAVRLSTRHPEMRILFVSGYAETDTVLDRLPNERVAFLQKPYTAAALGAEIRSLLDRP